jgi:hypothetical protein
LSDQCRSRARATQMRCRSAGIRIVKGILTPLNMRAMASSWHYLVACRTHRKACHSQATANSTSLSEQTCVDGRPQLQIWVSHGCSGGIFVHSRSPRTILKDLTVRVRRGSRCTGSGGSRGRGSAGISVRHSSTSLVASRRNSAGSARNTCDRRREATQYHGRSGTVQPPSSAGRVCRTCRAGCRTTCIARQSWRPFQGPSSPQMSGFSKDAWSPMGCTSAIERLLRGLRPTPHLAWHGCPRDQGHECFLVPLPAFTE